MPSDPKRSYYRTALLGLLAQEHHDPTNRRFGPDADAAWSIFQGHLDSADRIDLLLRDAAVKHPAAFAPRTIFSVDMRDGSYSTTDLPEDEPFGPSWKSPYGRDSGRQLWNEALGWRTEAPKQLWQRAVATWEVAPDNPTAELRLDATSRLLVVGAGAIAALAERFLADANLDWGRQVISAASTPAGIQLAGIAPLVAGSRNAARVIGLTGSVEGALHALGQWPADQIIEPSNPTDLESAFLAAVRSPA